jgi:ATP-dependent DNA ligase
MSLPLSVSYPPMEAQPASELPSGTDWQYEPKWDGFRGLAFRDGKKITLQSKSGKPLTRYFPELVAALLDLSPRQFVLDGEIVIALDGSLSFDHLLMRIHPAPSRILKLSQSTPCAFLVFDLLVNERGKSLTHFPLSVRRKELEAFAQRYLKGKGLIRLSPATQDLAKARKWFAIGSGLDGIIAKRRDMSYQSGERKGIKKVKWQRTADCVVGGFRYLEKKPEVGSLLLGLYDPVGNLDHVGFTSSISALARPALTSKLRKLVRPPGFTGKAPGGPSRWSKRSGDWEPLAPKLVVEVQFDHFSGGRFRHGTKFLRWRPDKAPTQCTFEQVKRENRSALSLF